MSIQGDLLVVIATVCWDSYAVLSLPLLRTHPPLVVAAFTMLFRASPQLLSPSPASCTPSGVSWAWRVEGGPRLEKQIFASIG